MPFVNFESGWKLARGDCGKLERLELRVERVSQVSLRMRLRCRIIEGATMAASLSDASHDREILQRARARSRAAYTFQHSVDPFSIGYIDCGNDSSPLEYIYNTRVVCEKPSRANLTSAGGVAGAGATQRELARHEVLNEVVAHTRRLLKYLWTSRRAYLARVSFLRS